LEEPQLRDQLSSSAQGLGVDGWTTLDHDKMWVVSGWAGLSRVEGTAVRMQSLQESSVHYFQRPDADYLGVDSSRTGLAGYAGRVSLNKQKGNWMFNSALGVVSPGFEVTECQIIFKGQDITDADPDERARMGLFLAFQYPVAVPGVTVTKYLRTVLNAHRETRGEEPIALKEFRQSVEAAMQLTSVPKEFSGRYLNEGFSGGEKKRMEILQLVLQRPEMAILDETDSGLDIDALRVVANGVNAVAGPDMGVLIITHYQRILHLVQPSHVHVMYQGRIVKQGGPELVDELEAKGYGWIAEELEAAA